MSGTSKTAAAIDIADLRFGYGTDADVIAIPRFTIAAGERVFLFGPSGSGKTTLLSLIGGVLVPQQGVVTVLGESLSTKGGAARDRFRADHIGFIFQQFNLLPYLSVVDNVCLPCRYSERRLKRVQTADGTEQKAAARLLDALGIDAELRSRAATQLSVGQQQRIAVARALIGRPELIIADEPTSALDADRRREFIELLLSESARADSAVVFVSHDRSLADYFDRSIDLPAVNNVAGAENAA
ncbi:MAG: ABC transporter ATP-binding protein [Pseudomonadota bacterium]